MATVHLTCTHVSQNVIYVTWSIMSGYILSMYSAWFSHAWLHTAAMETALLLYNYADTQGSKH